MISNKDEYTIRSGWPVNEDRKSPLQLLIEKEAEPLGTEEKKAGCNGLDAELLIFLADFAARFPNKWPTIREYVRDVRANHEELALRLKVSSRTVSRHLADLRAEARKWNGGPYITEHQT